MSDLITSECWTCIVGLHDECFQPLDKEGESFCCCHGKEHTADEAGEYARTVGRPLSKTADITDVLSTGRKRADKLYPIYDGMECEWAGLLYAGGGVEPIVGCQGNLLYAERGKYARHHGPNKSVLENAPGNVHRICERCHNRWHSLNDPFYGKDRPPEGKPWMPVGHQWIDHDPTTQATEEDVEENEKYWAGNPASRKEND